MTELSPKTRASQTTTLRVVPEYNQHENHWAARHELGSAHSYSVPQIAVERLAKKLFQPGWKITASAHNEYQIEGVLQ